MDHTDHVALLRDGIGSLSVVADADAGRSPVWADIGAGTGAFTMALADLLGPGATIIAIDRDAGALRANAAAMARRFPEVVLQTVVGDLESPLDLPRLDGLVAANSLHFVPRERQVAAVAGLAEHVVPGGRFIVVEYDADRGNPWVPHPFSFPTWERFAVEAGLAPPRLIGRVPSRFPRSDLRRDVEGARMSVFSSRTKAALTRACQPPTHGDGNACPDRPDRDGEAPGAR